jgi:N-methylhydantoinase A/oxoprolinase/acetone carboxylase beta subunit
VPVISAEEEAMRPKIPLIDGEIPTAEQLIALRGERGTSLPKDRKMIRIGIDVGGTNTDAVVMDGTTVIAGVKAATTGDVMTGVVNALKAVLEASKMEASAIDVVMIGTTHFTNAVVQRRDLAKTAAVRLGLPATASLPPMVDWPEDLKVAIGGTGYLAHGGNEFDGRVISPIDEKELLGIAEDIKSKGINTIAITSVFSPVTGEFEKQAGEILAKALPGVHITLSSDIGRIGLLERENAAIMNACLRDLSKHVIEAFRKAIAETGIKGRFYLTQNDGTLMDAEFAEKFPVLTFASGPTNSMRGAAFLSGVADAIVVDIGGTTSDVGSLHKGFPRQATVAVEVGGVRTNFRMPDVFSIGLGGGSHVVETGGAIKVGPTSVGYKIVTEALIFGGKTLTTSDVVVASGRYELGDRSKVAHLKPDFIDRTQARIMSMLEDCVERSRLSPEPLPVIVVGGGSILVDGPIGGLEVIKPNHFAVANAVGAAIAQVSGEVDRVYALAEIGRDQALADAKQRATDAAVAAGALRSSIEIVDVEDVPLAYLPGNATRVRVKAVGELHVG